jgi:hypothetical protein
MIWAYMGRRNEVPNCRSGNGAGAGLAPLSRSGRTATGCRRWKGSIDTAHFTFAHLSFEKGESEILDIKALCRSLVRVATDHMRWIASPAR